MSKSGITFHPLGVNTCEMGGVRPQERSFVQAGLADHFLQLFWFDDSTAQVLFENREHRRAEEIHIRLGAGKMNPLTLTLL